MKRQILSAALAFLVWPWPALGGETVSGEADGYSFSIEEVSEVKQGYPGYTQGMPGQPVIPPPADGGALNVIDKVVNLADKVWTIVARSQPVVNVAVKYATAVPDGVATWGQLQGWSRPYTKRYRFAARNPYGVRVADVLYQVNYTCKGNLNGRGQFLTGVAVEPLSVTTAWGYNLNISVEVPDSTVVNVGTHEDPLAAMQVQIKWQLHTIVKDVQEKAIYYVQGDGFIQTIGDPFRAAEGKRLAERSAGAAAELAAPVFY